MDLLSLLPTILGSAAVTTLMNPLAQALYEKIGLIMVPTKEAEQYLIEEIKNSTDPPSVKAFKIKNVAKLLKEYENQYDIYQIAQENLDTDAEHDHSADVDVEWLSRFMDSCKHVSADDVKIIWGKLLSEECKKPNSVPIRLISILPTLSKELAQSFSDICNLSLQHVGFDGNIFTVNNQYTPIIYCSRQRDFWGSKIFSLLTLSELASIGLIQFDSKGFKIESDTEQEEFTKYFLYNSIVYKISSETNSIDVGEVLFAECGQALCKVLTLQPVTNFEKAIPRMFKKYKVENLDSIIQHS